MYKFTDADIKDCCIVKGAAARKCSECGDNTKYVDYIFETPLCSHKCQDKLTQKYHESVKVRSRG